MLRAYKVFLATAYPQSELVGTMKRLLACLALCASLSASAQDDNCTVLGVQELSLLYSELSSSIDSITTSLGALSNELSDALNGMSSSETGLSISELEIIEVRSRRHVHSNIDADGNLADGNGHPCTNGAAAEQEWLNYAQDTLLSRIQNGWNLLHQESVERNTDWYRSGNSCTGNQVFYGWSYIQMTFVKYAED